MERILIKDLGKRKAGEIYDYPRDVWRGMARADGRPLESFSRSVADAGPKRATGKRKK